MIVEDIMTKEERLEYLKKIIQKKGYSINETTKEIKVIDAHENIEKYDELITLVEFNDKDEMFINGIKED